MNSELISVIVPVYNVEQWVQECINSIILQTYKNIEIIIVDDGSTDNSGTICDQIASNDTRIKVFHKENGGLSDARNFGIDKACGKWITFIDSDDSIMNDTIETLYQLAVNTSADIAVCQYLLIDENGNEITRDVSLEKAKEILLQGNNSIMTDYILNNNIGTVAWGKLYKTSMFENIRYPKGKYHEDVFTTYKLIARCEKLVYTSEKKYYYRQREQSITQSTFSPKHLDSLDGALEKYEFICRHYPLLKDIAAQNIIYACNSCAYKMVKSGVRDRIYWDKIQRLYRLYGKAYLTGSKRFSIKLFTLFGVINARLLLLPCRHIVKLVNL